MFRVDIDRTAIRYLERIESRMDALSRISADVVSEEVARGVSKRQPKELGGYADSLEWSSLKTVDGDYVAIVRIPENAKRIRIGSVSGRSAVIYVRPKERRSGWDVGSFILASKNPWTYKTIPYLPKKSDADIIVRFVSWREYDFVSKRRMKDSRDVVASLRRHGVTFGTRSDSVLQDDGNVYRDLGFEVLRKEFGIETRAVPHWRPAYVDALYRVYSWLPMYAVRVLFNPMKSVHERVIRKRIGMVEPSMLEDYMRFSVAIHKGA